MTLLGPNSCPSLGLKMINFLSLFWLLHKISYLSQQDYDKSISERIFNFFRQGKKLGPLFREQQEKSLLTFCSIGILNQSGEVHWSSSAMQPICSLSSARRLLTTLSKAKSSVKLLESGHPPYLSTARGPMGFVRFSSISKFVSSPHALQLNSPLC